MKSFITLLDLVAVVALTRTAVAVAIGLAYSRMTQDALVSLSILTFKF